MTPEKIINNMLAEGELINISDKVTMQVIDAEFKGNNIAVIQLIGYSNDLDCYISTNYYANLNEAKRFGLFLTDFASKYEQKDIEMKSDVRK